MSRAVHKLVVMAGWLIPLACSVYDASLLRGGDGDGDDDARGGSVAGAGRGGNTSGVGAIGGTAPGSTPSGGSGALGGTGTNPNGGSTVGTSGTDGEGGSDPGAGGAPGGDAGAGSIPIGGEGPGLVFDTMEDGNHIFPLTSSARGRWYLSHDTTTGEQTEITELMADIPDGRDGSTRAAHVVSSGFSSWGASVGFTFEDTSSLVRVPFDAAGYSGISFYARVESGSATAVRVNFPDMNTDPMGEVCVDAVDAGTAGCLDHFGTNLQLTTTFTQYTFVFQDQTQKGWGKYEPALDPSKLLGMEVSWGLNTSIDIWIDDVMLLP